MQNAIDLVTKETRSSAKVVAYLASEAGVPGIKQGSIPVKIPEKGSVKFFGDKDAKFQAITHLRSISGGLHDGIITSGDIDPVFEPTLRALVASLPPRGRTLSSRALYSFVHGTAPPKDAVTLDEWYSANRTDVNEFRRRLWNDHPPFRALVRLIWENSLPGWPGLGPGLKHPVAKPGLLTEGAHDFVSLEFLWETL
jgi:hypothetical protein